MGKYDWAPYDITKRFAINPPNDPKLSLDSRVLSTACRIVEHILDSKNADVYILAKKYVAPYLTTGDDLDYQQEIENLKNDKEDLCDQINNLEAANIENGKQLLVEVNKIEIQVEDLQRIIEMKDKLISGIQKMFDSVMEERIIYRDRIKALIMRYDLSPSLILTLLHGIDNL